MVTYSQQKQKLDRLFIICRNIEVCFPFQVNCIALWL